MSADALLSRLDKVRKTGPNSWVACCPAHPDKTPSLSIRDADEGYVLAHCFGGCGIDEILGAVGLTIDELFPERLADHKAVRRPFPAADVLESVAAEAMIVAVAASNVRAGVVLSDSDHERLLAAVERIFEARRMANGER